VVAMKEQSLTKGLKQINANNQISIFLNGIHHNIIHLNFIEKLPLGVKNEPF